MIKFKLVAGKFKYELTLNNKITVIRGESASGKTLLCNLIEKSFKTDAIRIECDIDYDILIRKPKRYDIVMQAYENSLIFIDEDSPILRDEEFIKTALSYKIYFVLFTRDCKNIKIPYSVLDTYKLIKSNLGVYTIVPFYDK